MQRASHYSIYRPAKAKPELHPVRYEKVEPGEEQILPPREQRELDALPSALDRSEQD